MLTILGVCVEAVFGFAWWVLGARLGDFQCLLDDDGWRSSEGEVVALPSWVLAKDVGWGIPCSMWISTEMGRGLKRFRLGMASTMWSEPELVWWYTYTFATLLPNLSDFYGLVASPCLLVSRWGCTHKRCFLKSFLASYCIAWLPLAWKACNWWQLPPRRAPSKRSRRCNSGTFSDCPRKRSRGSRDLPHCQAG